ncbi:MAG: hypothetical protein P1U70_26485 [Saprospiraceae bacterium]|nr:hypothetical protein [Saprospiraceae bacterium]
MIKKIKVPLFLGLIIFSLNIEAAETYVVPPTSSTHSSVPVISDVAMERCVKNYNEAKWLSEKIDTMAVNNYSQSAVNNYNEKVRLHSQMTSIFNRDCAGKQSRSAYEAAKKLNNER